MARVYLHWGGECFDDVAATLCDFMEANGSSPDPRWTDAPYLAARFMAWAIDSHRMKGKHPLDFLSVGLVDSEEWGDYVGRIDTSSAGIVTLSAGPSCDDLAVVGMFMDGDVYEESA